MPKFFGRQRKCGWRSLILKGRVVFPEPSRWGWCLTRPVLAWNGKPLPFFALLGLKFGLKSKREVFEVCVYIFLLDTFRSTTTPLSIIYPFDTFQSTITPIIYYIYPFDTFQSTTTPLSMVQGSKITVQFRRWTSSGASCFRMTSSERGPPRPRSTLMLGGSKSWCPMP